MTIARNRPSITLSPRKYDVAGLPARYFGPGELEALLHLYESIAPRVVVEFGVNTGRNAVAALRNIPSINRYIGVDVEPGYQTRMPVQRREVPARPGELALHDPRFELIVRPRGTFDLVPTDLPAADVVFIDADHSRVAVEHDTALARSIVRSGGLVIWHDDNGRPVVEVTQTLNDLCSSGDPIHHVANTWLSFETRQAIYRHEG